MRQAQAPQEEETPWLLAGLTMPAWLSPQLQAEPKPEQPDGEDLVGWSWGEGQPVADIAILCTKSLNFMLLLDPRDKPHSCSSGSSEFQQGAVEGDCFWVGPIQNKPLNHYRESDWAEQHFCKTTSILLNLLPRITQLTNKQKARSFNK